MTIHATYRYTCDGCGSSWSDTYEVPRGSPLMEPDRGRFTYAYNLCDRCATIMYDQVRKSFEKMREKP